MDHFEESKKVSDFRILTDAAPLKHVTSANASGTATVDFRILTDAAPLKPEGYYSAPVPSSHFRILTDAAPLKLWLDLETTGLDPQTSASSRMRPH